MEVISRLPSREKIRSTMCPEVEVIVPTLKRTFSNFGQYNNFMTSEYAPSYRKRVLSKTRTERTMFGPYLDNGEEGYRLAAILGCEILGCLLLPVTLTIKSFYHYIVHPLKLMAWEHVKTCYSTPERCILSGSYTEIVIRAIVEYNDESSEMSEVLNYRRYHSLLALANYINPYWSKVYWALNIAWMAPEVYFRYYFTSAQKSLPQKQTACMLRNTIDAAEKESSVIREKLLSSERLTRNGVSYAQDVMSVSSSRQHHTNRQRRRNGKLNAEQARNLSTATIDFGPHSDWMALDNKCISKNIRRYNYNLCFFRYIEQDGVLVGKFKGWGQRELKSNNQKPQNPANTKFSSISEAVDTFVRLFMSSKEEEVESKSIDYTSHAYTDGDPCVNGIIRSADVHFKCHSGESTIEDVTEVDVCNYIVEVSTPLACTPELERAALAQATSLGVFEAESKFAEERETIAKLWRNKISADGFSGGKWEDILKVDETNMNSGDNMKSEDKQVNVRKEDHGKEEGQREVQQRSIDVDISGTSVELV